jgi:hypothetical protein
LYIDESVGLEPALGMGGEKLFKGAMYCTRLLEIDLGHLCTLPQFRRDA